MADYSSTIPPRNHYLRIFTALVPLFVHNQSRNCSTPFNFLLLITSPDYSNKRLVYLLVTTTIFEQIDMLLNIQYSTSIYSNLATFPDLYTTKVKFIRSKAMWQSKRWLIRRVLTKRAFPRCVYRSLRGATVEAVQNKWEDVHNYAITSRIFREDVG